MKEEYYQGFLDTLSQAGLFKSGQFSILEAIKSSIVDKIRELSPGQRRLKWLELIKKKDSELPYV